MFFCMYGSIVDFLRLTPEIVSNLKVRLNDNKGIVLREYLEDKDLFEKKSVLWYTGKSWFNVGEYYLSLVRISGDDWLLTSVGKITEKLDDQKDFIGPAWKSEILPEYSHFYGTLHVNFHRGTRHQSQVMHYKTVSDDIKVSKLDSVPFTGDEFPGIDNIRNLSWSELNQIFKQNKTTWLNGLSNSKAIYLIHDKKTGKNYVGSAASDDEMLLSRWKSYATTGHGGNKYFKKLFEEGGLKYFEDNFEYSVLEPHDYRADTNFLLERESFWKKLLHTSVDEGGMNYN